MRVLNFIIDLPFRFVFALVGFTFRGWIGWVGIVLIALKLFGVIGWAWWVAALPLEYGVLYCLYMTIDGALYRAGLKKVGGYARFTTSDEQLASAEADQAIRNADAYDLFRTGKQIWNDITRTGGSPELRETKKKEALRHFDQAIANGYDTSEVFSLRGSCLNDLGFYFDALEDYNKAIQKQPNQGIANNYFMRSIIKDSLFDFEGSVADLKEAIQLSKLDNDDNRFWNNHAKSIGFDSQTAFYEWSLPREEMILFRKRTYTGERIADELNKIKRRR